MIISENVFKLLKPMPPFVREMRDANRADRKRQTRRVMKSQPRVNQQPCTPDFILYPRGMKSKVEPILFGNEIPEKILEYCPYGKPGEIRYMREPIYRGFGDVAHYQDDDVMVRSLLTGEAITWRWKKDVLSGLYMPKEAARTFKKYEFIRAERLQEISRDDAKAEGASHLWEWNAQRYEKNPEHFTRAVLHPYVANYSVLWDELNAKRGYGWEVNPWVWVIGYKPIEVQP